MNADRAPVRSSTGRPVPAIPRVPLAVSAEPKKVRVMFRDERAADAVIGPVPHASIQSMGDVILVRAGDDPDRLQLVAVLVAEAITGILIEASPNIGKAPS